MQTEHALQWEMHGDGTYVSFIAQRSEEGYGLVVKRDDTVVISDVATNATALFRKSQGVRAALQAIGYAPKPAASRTSQLLGGICWGPAAPLNLSIIDALR
jgi:hypothetical protein